MTTIELTTDTFTVKQENDLAVITILAGANALSTTVSGKDGFQDALKTIKASQQIKGVAILYSDQYLGNVEYKSFLQEIVSSKHYQDERRFDTTYKAALSQFFKVICKFPKPIVSGMSGDTGPTTFAINLSFDLRIVAENTTFFHPNLKLGLPPSPPLSYYLVQSLGSPRATEVILTKPELTAQEALNLGLITQIVPKEDLKKVCLEKLRLLSSISGNALVESRRMLQPNMIKMDKYMDEGFEASRRCMHSAKG